MTFVEKSTLTMTLLLLAVFTGYFALVLGPIAASPGDERDRLIALRSGSLGGYLLAIGVFAGIVLAMLEAESFWIAQAQLAAWVVAEVGEGVSKLVLYRRGV